PPATRRAMRQETPELYASSFLSLELRQDFSGMLIDFGRRGSRRARRVRQLHRDAGAAIVVALDQHLAGGDVRWGEGLGHVVDRSGGHAVAHQGGAELLDRRAGQDALDLVAESVAVLQPLRIGREARVACELGLADLRAEAAELAVIDDAQKQLA